MKTTLRFSLTLLLGIIVLTSCSQPKTNSYHSNEEYAKALMELNRLTALQTKDTVFFINEKQRVLANYQQTVDKLQSQASDSVYANYALSRFINLSYLSDGLHECMAYHDSLFILSKEYPQYVEQQARVANEIASCVVHSLERHPFSKESLLIDTLINIIKKHIATVYGAKANMKQQKQLLDRYVLQYLSRGIISIPEQLYRAFSYLYQKPQLTPKPIRFDKNYVINNKYGAAVSKIKQSDDFWRVLIFNTHHTNYDLVYLISIVRASIKVNQDIPVIIARNKNELSDAPMKHITKYIDGIYGYITLDSSDINYYSNAPAFIVQKPDGSFIYKGNDALDFLKWLESPFAKQKAIEEQRADSLLKANKVKQDSIASLPADTTLKHHQQIQNIDISLKGIWPNKVHIRIESYEFGSAKPYNADENGLSQILISDNNGRQMYDQWIINPPKGSTTNIVLLADRKGGVGFKISDTININAHKQYKQLQQNHKDILIYQSLVNEYPFQNSDFIIEAKKHLESLNDELYALLNDSTSAKQVLAVLSASEVMYHFKQQTKDSINYKTFNTIMNLSYFDSILYKSPFYGQAILSWLQYSSSSLKKGIDLLIGSQEWVPDTNFNKSVQYIWKVVSSMGREDMMIYIDTNYLAGCSNSDIDVEKRLQGYKRMTIGNKAPNIIWKEKGKSMQLYDLLADTIYVVFWADWCPHCRERLPEFYKQTTKAHSNIEVIAVNIDDTESSQNYGMKTMPQWHHVRAKEKWHSAIVDQWNIFATPTIYMLDSEFKIRKKLN